MSVVGVVGVVVGGAVAAVVESVAGVVILSYFPEKAMDVSLKGCCCDTILLLYLNVLACRRQGAVDLSNCV
jgi:hypothetical protein